MAMYYKFLGFENLCVDVLCVWFFLIIFLETNLNQ